jgi:hypothetical protein
MEKVRNATEVAAAKAKDGLKEGTADEGEKERELAKAALTVAELGESSLGRTERR